MKIITQRGLVENMDFERIKIDLEMQALEKNIQLTKGDINYLIKELKDILYALRGDNGITSYCEIKCLMLKILKDNKFKW